jgi:hypothetical protein
VSRYLEALKRPSNAIFAVVLIVLTAGVWTVVFFGGVLSRDLDGGIFVSVASAMRSGSPLYAGVLDNKDPLFFGVMAGSGAISPVLMFVLDWMWLAIASYGSFLLARKVMPLSTAFLVALVATPFILVGPFYSPGLTNTPGSAVALLALGLLLNRKAVAAGIALGALLFLKLTVFPAILICVLVALCIPTWRRTILRLLVAFAATTFAGLVLLFAFGSLSGYFDTFGHNRKYASDVMTYFGFEDSPMGHINRLRDSWTTGEWLAIAVVLVIAVLGIIRLKPWQSTQRDEQRLIALWLPITLVLVGLSLAMTFVWSHHTQAIYLVSVLAVIVFAAVVSGKKLRWLTWILVLVATWILSGWLTPSNFVDSWDARRLAYDTSIAAVHEVPKDAVLLSTIPLNDFTFARLGTNDDRGFMTGVPSRAHLACPAFHLYDFSPAEDFAALNSCIQNVDAILLTDNFVNFGNGGRAPFARPILDYVANAFTCIKVDTSQICQRKATP